MRRRCTKSVVGRHLCVWPLLAAPAVLTWHELLRCPATAAQSTGVESGEGGRSGSRAQTPEDKSRLDELRGLIRKMCAAGNFDDALAPAKEVVELCRRQHGDDGLDTADALRRLETVAAIVALPLGRQSELAETYAADEQRQELHRQGKYDLALQLAREQLKTRERLLGQEHQDTLVAVSETGELLRVLGREEEAEPLVRRAFKGTRRVLGEEHLGTLVCLNNMATFLGSRGKHAEAEPLFRQGLDTLRRVHGDEHPTTLMVMNNFAMLLLNSQGRAAEAEALLRETLDLQRRILGGEHVHTLMSITNVGWALFHQGKFGEAEALFRQAWEGRGRTLGEEHPETTAAMSNVAEALVIQGRLSEAEPIARLALQTLRRSLGDDHPATLTSLTTLTRLMRGQGRLAEATLLMERILSICSTSLGKDHPRTISAMNNMAVLYDRSGQPGKAEHLYRETLGLRRTVYGNEHPETLRTMNNLAYFLADAGRYDEARSLNTQAMEVRRRVLGDEHPDTLHSMNSLAVLFRKQGRYSEAETLLREAVETGQRVLGEDHPDLLRWLNHLSVLLAARGSYVEAVAVAEEAAGTFERVRLAASSTGLGRAGLTGLRSPLPQLTACLLRIGKPLEAWKRWESNLARGLLDAVSAHSLRPLSPGEFEEERVLLGQLVAASERIQSVASEDGGDEAHAVMQRVRRERDALISEHAAMQRRLEDKYGVAAGRVHELAHIQRRLPEDAAILTWVDVEGDPLSANPGGEHWACVVRRQGEPVWVELVGSGVDGLWTDTDSQRCKLVREALSTRQSTPPNLQRDLALLYGQRVAPVEAHLAGVRRLIVLPAGWMAGVPVEALTQEYVVTYSPSGTMHAWLHDQTHAPREKSGTSARLLALGDPIFAERGDATATAAVPTPPDFGVYVAAVAPDSNAANHGLEGGDVLLRYGRHRLATLAELDSVMASAATRDGAQPGATIPIAVWRGGRELELGVAPGRLGVRLSDQPAREAVGARLRLDSVLAATRSAPVTRLPGTRVEVEAIARLLERSDGKEGHFDTTILLGSAAAEEKLVELAASGGLAEYSIVHLATHGVIDDDVAMRSALILSQTRPFDSGNSPKANEGVFDGRLTAEQIVRTWHLDADLVTLSACGTASGIAPGGEGFLGFAQALFIAGARNLVLSLWTVDDVSTAILMEDFYRNLLVQRMPMAVALHRAKAKLRKMTRSEVENRVRNFDGLSRDGSVSARAGSSRLQLTTDRPFEHPYYWAPFILIGPG